MGKDRLFSIHTNIKTKNEKHWVNPILPFIKWTNIYVKSQMSKVVIHLSPSVHIKHAVVLAIKIPHSWKGMQNKQLVYVIEW